MARKKRRSASSATSPAGRRPGCCSAANAGACYNEEIALADAIVTFPVETAFASLNIAQAVLLMSL